MLLDLKVQEERLVSLVLEFMDKKETKVFLGKCRKNNYKFLITKNIFSFPGIPGKKGERGFKGQAGAPGDSRDGRPGLPGRAGIPGMNLVDFSCKWDLSILLFLRSKR